MFIYSPSYYSPTLKFDIWLFVYVYIYFLQNGLNTFYEQNTNVEGAEWVVLSVIRLVIDSYIYVRTGNFLLVFQVLLNS